MSDFKFDHTPVDGWPTDYAKLAELSNRGVDLLLSDSTNSERPGWTPSEMVIGPALDEVFESYSHVYVQLDYQQPHVPGFLSLPPCVFVSHLCLP